MRQVKVEVLGVYDPESKLIRLRAVEPLLVIYLFFFYIYYYLAIFILSPRAIGLCEKLMDRIKERHQF